jgi:penicillin-binding protein 1B
MGSDSSKSTSKPRSKSTKAVSQSTSAPVRAPKKPSATRARSPSSRTRRHQKCGSKASKPRNSKSNNSHSGNKNTRSSLFKRCCKWSALFALTASVALAVVMVYLDARVTQTFEGKRWAIPAKVFARPLRVFEGRPLNAGALEQELKQLGYEAVGYPQRPGQYSVYRGQFHIYLREFLFWDGLQPAARVNLTLAQGRVQHLQSPQLTQAGDIPEVRLEPIRVGGIYPNHNEDRELVSLDEVPELLKTGLVTVEDKGFYEHWGLSVRGIARAMLANIQAGSMVQGGSTLTQQLVKNMYLNRERTLSRKAVEALMAILLEVHYSKPQILETYLNEIYLGQSGRRSIHGFGLGAQYYFRRSLNYLKPQELALLVGIIKGPSYYNPHRYPQRALDRRNQVLDIWKEAGILSQAQWLKATSAALGVSKKAPYLNVEYPAYLDLVKRQLKHDYRESDLTSEGLRIYTSLDPFAQRQAEERTAKSLETLENRYQLSSGTLESASIVTDTHSGDVLAVVGSRSPRYFGFNRALDARRPIGSLIKPVVFLTALAQPERYHLGSLLLDERYEWINKQGQRWVPKNYDRKSHGQVSLQDVLTHSYNQATVRLGMDIGVKEVIYTMKSLGLVRDVAPFPALLLGSVSLTPYEVSSLYQTIASGGYLMPLRAIRAVTTAEGEPLTRYGMKLQSALDPASVYLLQLALQRTVEQGSGRYAKQQLPHLQLAGKTGTTNDQRDSWFAGFSGDKTTVVWVGRDDNGVTPLTGSSGALRVWTAIMDRIAVAPVQLRAPRSVINTAYDPVTGQLFNAPCGSYPQIAIHKDSLALAQSCDASESDWLDDLKQWFSGP